MNVQQLKALLAKANDEDIVTFSFNGEAPIVTDAKIKYIRPDNTISDKKIKSGFRAFVFTTRLTPANAVKDFIKKRNEAAECGKKPIVYKPAVIDMPVATPKSAKKAVKDTKKK